MRKRREFTLLNADLKLPRFNLARFGRIRRRSAVGASVWRRRIERWREGPAGAGVMSHSTTPC